MIQNLSELVTRIVRQTLRQLRVAMPARVVRYDAGRQMVQVEIVQPEVMPDGEVVQQPVISEVPVSWPRAGGAWMTFPINRGDTGLVVFADRDIGGWVSDNDGGIPDSERTHSITDGVFVPGIQGGGVDANGEDVELQYRGSTIHIRQSGDVDVACPNFNVDTGNFNVSASAFNVSADTADFDVPDTTFSGNVTVQQLLSFLGGMAGSNDAGGAAAISGDLVVTDGDITAEGISLTSHTHGGVESGDASTGGPQ